MRDIIKETLLEIFNTKDAHVGMNNQWFHWIIKKLKQQK
jgi:uncharacterized ferritin-like protein (DUF455 family)